MFLTCSSPSDDLPYESISIYASEGKRSNESIETQKYIASGEVTTWWYSEGLESLLAEDLVVKEGLVQVNLEDSQRVTLFKNLWEAHLQGLKYLVDISAQTT